MKAVITMVPASAKSFATSRCAGCFPRDLRVRTLSSCSVHGARCRRPRRRCGAVVDVIPVQLRLLTSIYLIRRDCKPNHTAFLIQQFFSIFCRDSRIVPRNIGCFLLSQSIILTYLRIHKIEAFHIYSIIRYNHFIIIRAEINNVKLIRGNIQSFCRRELHSSVI